MVSFDVHTVHQHLKSSQLVNGINCGHAGDHLGDLGSDTLGVRRRAAAS